MSDRHQPPDEDQEVERQHRREHLRRGDPGGEPGGGLRLDEDDAEHDEDERRDEEEGRQPATPVVQLTEPGDDGRQARRGKAAQVGGPRIGPDPGGLHAGVRLLCGVRATRLVDAESTPANAPGISPGTETPGDRSACHDRPASSPVTTRPSSA